MPCGCKLIFASLLFGLKKKDCHQIDSLLRDSGCGHAQVRTHLARQPRLGVLSGKVYISLLSFATFHLFFFKSQRGELNGIVGNILESDEGLRVEIFATLFLLRCSTAFNLLFCQGKVGSVGSFRISHLKFPP